MTRVEDFAVGVIGLIGNPKAFNEAFNVCGDETPTYREVIDIVSEYLGKKAVTINIHPNFYANELPEWRKGELLGGRCLDSINSNKKLKEAVPEFSQSISIKEGIQRTLDAYKTSGYQYGIDWNFDAQTDRIIKKWCKTSLIDFNTENLRFVDYLGKASKSERSMYRDEFFKDNTIYKFLKRIPIMVSKIKKLVTN